MSPQDVVSQLNAVGVEEKPAIYRELLRNTKVDQASDAYGPVDSHATNPKTGEAITVKASEGDVAMELDGRWISVFRWRNGRVMFKASIQDPKDPVSVAAFALAEGLGATVRGEEGETYSRRASLG